MEAWRGWVEMGPAPHSLLSTTLHETWWAEGFPGPPDADPRFEGYPSLGDMHSTLRVDKDKWFLHGALYFRNPKPPSSKAS